MLWPLTIACIDESGNRLPHAAIQIVETLNPSVSVDAYDIDGQLVASPVAGPTGMAKVFLLNGLIDYRYVLDPYESEWITDIAIAPFGRPGRWRDDVGGAIVAGTTTDFPITVPNLGVQKVPRSVRVALDFDHPSVEDLTVEVVHPLEDPDNPGNPWIGYLFGAAIPGSAATPPSGSFSGTVTFDDINVDAPPLDPIVLSDGLVSTTVGGRTVGLGLRFWQSAPPDLPGYYAEGAWKLRFVDTGTAGGTLNNWTLTFPPNL
jgi:hypothetical protein